MASRLNFHKSNNKQNFRVKSSKITYNYINFDISNQNNNNNINRIQSSLKAKKTKIPIQNNRNNHQLNIIYFPYINLNNYFINNLQEKTSKKINIKNDKRTIYASRYTSNYKNRYIKKSSEKKKLLKSKRKNSNYLYRKNNTLSRKKYNIGNKKDLENAKKNLDIKELPKLDKVEGIIKEQKKKYKLKDNKIYKNVKVDNNKKTSKKYILKTNDKTKIKERQDKININQVKKVIKEDENAIKGEIKNEEKEEIIIKNIKEIKEFCEVNIKKIKKKSKMKARIIKTKIKN